MKYKAAQRQSKQSADERALNRNRNGPQKMLLVAEQLNELIGYTSGRSNISKDLKQDLLKLCKALALAKKEFNPLVEERSASDASKEEQSTQTDSFIFAGNATMQHEMLQLAGVIEKRPKHPTARTAWLKPADETWPKKRSAKTGKKPKRKKGTASASNHGGQFGFETRK